MFYAHISLRGEEVWFKNRQFRVFLPVSYEDILPSFCGPPGDCLVGQARGCYWWLVRDTLIVAFCHFAQTFWEVAGAYESSFCSKMNVSLNGVDNQMCWEHSSTGSW